MRWTTISTVPCTMLHRQDMRRLWSSCSWQERRINEKWNFPTRTAEKERLIGIGWRSSSDMDGVADDLENLQTHGDNEVYCIMSKKIRVTAYVVLIGILISSCAPKKDTNATFDQNTSETEQPEEDLVSEEQPEEDLVSEKVQKENFVSEEAETNAIEEKRYGFDVFITGNSYEEEYRNSIEWLQNQIQTREPETENEYDQYFRQLKIDNLTDTLEAYMEFVDILCGNESLDSEERERTYQKAMAFLLASCKMHEGYEYEHDSMPNDRVYSYNAIGNYSFAYGQESTNRIIAEIIEMQFKEYPIDTCHAQFKKVIESYQDSYRYELVILDDSTESWEKEFYHCMQVTEQYMSDNDRPNEAANVRAFAEYVSEWADKGEAYEGIGPVGSALVYYECAARKEAFRTGTIVLLMLCEQEEIAYEYLFDYESLYKKVDNDLREFHNMMMKR
ncbi:MAG: hypothetical protein K2N95_08055 [Lachnospiraceae bacterium]|nr:hypothetical protein [Lachnospiraceae bacterium]